MGLIAIAFAPWQAYLVLSQWLYGVCSTGRWLYVGSVLAVFYRLAVVGLQGILLAGGGMNTACSTGWRLCACIVFYRLAAVGLQCILWAGGDVNAVCSMDVLRAGRCVPAVCSMGRQ